MRAAALAERDNNGDTAVHWCAALNTSAEVIIANIITHINMLGSITHVQCVSMNVKLLQEYQYDTNIIMIELRLCVIVNKTDIQLSSCGEKSGCPNWERQWWENSCTLVCSEEHISWGNYSKSHYSHHHARVYNTCSVYIHECIVVSEVTLWN